MAWSEKKMTNRKEVGKVHKCNITPANLLQFIMVSEKERETMLKRDFFLTHKNNVVTSNGALHAAAATAAAWNALFFVLSFPHNEQTEKESEKKLWQNEKVFTAFHNVCVLLPLLHCDKVSVCSFSLSLSLPSISSLFLLNDNHSRWNYCGEESF
jgi:hypothetical protein